MKNMNKKSKKKKIWRKKILNNKILFKKFKMIKLRIKNNKINKIKLVIRKDKAYKKNKWYFQKLSNVFFFNFFFFQKNFRLIHRLFNWII